MSSYAAQTNVSVERSMTEIRKTIDRYGGRGVVQAEAADGTAALIGFEFQADSGRRVVRFVLPLPDPGEREFHRTPTGLSRTKDAARKQYEQAVRQRWRSLGIVIKAKFETVALGINDFETEFLAHIVLPSGTTMGEWAKPQVALSYETQTMPDQVYGLAASTAVPSASTERAIGTGSLDDEDVADAEIID